MGCHIVVPSMLQLATVIFLLFAATIADSIYSSHFASAKLLESISILSDRKTLKLSHSYKVSTVCKKTGLCLSITTEDCDHNHDSSIDSIVAADSEALREESSNTRTIDDRISLQMTDSKNVTKTVKKRSRTLLEMQRYIIPCAFIISVLTPMASVYQMTKLYPSVRDRFTNQKLLQLSLDTIPIQTVLKTMQMTISSVVNKKYNAWLAFAVSGFLQGGVYGHCNIYFTQQLGIAKGTESLAYFLFYNQIAN